MTGELSPSSAILKNLKGLCSHNGSRTHDAVVDHFAGLGYYISSRILDTGAFGLAQTWARLFLVYVHERTLSNCAIPYVFPKGADAARVAVSARRVADSARHRRLIRPVHPEPPRPLRSPMEASARASLVWAPTRFCANTSCFETPSATSPTRAELSSGLKSWH